jgi:hypothetical protein
MNIITTFAPPPIPDRRYDWSAVDADNYDPDPSMTISRCIGWGPTEADAIADLKVATEWGQC